MYLYVETKRKDLYGNDLLLCTNNNLLTSKMSTKS